MVKKWVLFGEYSEAKEGTNYKAFDYKKYLKTKKIYGIVISEDKIEISNKEYLNPILIFSNKIKNEIENRLENILGEEAELVKRNIDSEIPLI